MSLTTNNNEQHPYLKIMNRFNSNHKNKDGTKFLTKHTLADCNCGVSFNLQDSVGKLCVNCGKEYQVTISNPLTSSVYALFNTIQNKESEQTKTGNATTSEKKRKISEVNPSTQSPQELNPSTCFVDVLNRLSLTYLYPNCPENNIVFVREATSYICNNINKEPVINIMHVIADNKKRLLPVVTVVKPTRCKISDELSEEPLESLFNSEPNLPILPKPSPPSLPIGVQVKSVPTPSETKIPGSIVKVGPNIPKMIAKTIASRSLPSFAQLPYSFPIFPIVTSNDSSNLMVNASKTHVKDA